MAAPTELITHGTAQSYYDLDDEPSNTPVIKVGELAYKFDRDMTASKNVNGTTVFEAHSDPRLVISFTGQINATAGLAAQGPGSEVSALANFAATFRTMDYAVGTMIMENIEDSVKHLERGVASTKFDVRYMPYI